MPCRSPLQRPTLEPLLSLRSEAIFQRKAVSSLGLRGAPTGDHPTGNYELRPAGKAADGGFRSNQEKPLREPRVGRVNALNNVSTGGKPYDIISGITLPVPPSGCVPTRAASSPPPLSFVRLKPPDVVRPAPPRGSPPPRRTACRHWQRGRGGLVWPGLPPTPMASAHRPIWPLPINHMASAHPNYRRAHTHPCRVRTGWPWRTGTSRRPISVTVGRTRPTCRSRTEGGRRQR